MCVLKVPQGCLKFNCDQFICIAIGKLASVDLAPKYWVRILTNPSEIGAFNTPQGAHSHCPDRRLEVDFKKCLGTTLGYWAQR